MRQISTSNGCRSLRSVESGLRPNSSEISLPAPTNLPLGDDHGISTMSFVLTLRIGITAPSQFAKSGGDGQAGSADRGKETADQADEHGPSHSAHQQCRCDREREGDLTECLPVDGRSFETVEREIGGCRSE